MTSPRGKKGGGMAEEGTLSIVRRGTSYQVRYASNNPYAQERPPHTCRDEETLRAFLHQLGVDGAAMQQVCADVRRASVTVLPIVLSLAEIQACFRPSS